MWTSEALGPGRPATAYMAAKANEHLTADPTRSSREPVTQRPRSLPTSDPRGTRAEGTAQFAHRHRLDPQGPPATLRRSMAARWAAPQKPPRSHRRQPRPSLKIREPGHPRSRHSPHGGPGAHGATERLTLAEEPDEYDPHPRQPSRERPAEGQPATRQRRLHHLRPSSDLTLSYEARGRAPNTQSRPTFASGHGQEVSEFTREIQDSQQAEPSSTHRIYLVECAEKWPC